MADLNSRMPTHVHSQCYSRDLYSLLCPSKQEQKCRIREETMSGSGPGKHVDRPREGTRGPMIMSLKVREHTKLHVF